jgi:hypothetical protein
MAAAQRFLELEIYPAQKTSCIVRYILKRRDQLLPDQTLAGRDGVVVWIVSKSRG